MKSYFPTKDYVLVHFSHYEVKNYKHFAENPSYEQIEEFVDETMTQDEDSYGVLTRAMLEYMLELCDTL